MKYLSYRTICCLGLSILISPAWLVSSLAGGCAVSDGSELPSDDGCMLAFVYNQKDDHRLVVLDEKSRRRYEATLQEPKKAPFWEEGKVYVLGTSGTVQSFSLTPSGLVAGKEESLLTGIVRSSKYLRGQHRLYVIRSGYDDQRNPFNELVVIDFPARKTLWTKRLEEAGQLNIYTTVTVTGENLIQVFDCDTGAKVTKVSTVNAAPANDVNGQK
jgi:hypothetical protein